MSRASIEPRVGQSPEQYQRYRPWFDNARRLRELTAELEALSLRTIEQAEGWQPKS